MVEADEQVGHVDGGGQAVLAGDDGGMGKGRVDLCGAEEQWVKLAAGGGDEDVARAESRAIPRPQEHASWTLARPGKMTTPRS